MTTDTAIVKIVVLGLAGISVLGLVAATLLLAIGVAPASIGLVTALAGPAVGGLTGILASTRTADILDRAQNR